MVMPYNNNYFFDDEMDSNYEWLKKKSQKKISPRESPPLSSSIKKKLREKKKNSPQKKIDRKKKEKAIILFSEKKFDDEEEFDNDYPWLKKGRRLKKEDEIVKKKSPKKIIKNDWSRITLDDYVDDFEYYSKLPVVATPVVVPPPVVTVRSPPTILGTTGSTSTVGSGGALGTSVRSAGGALASIATTATGVLGTAVRSAGGAIATSASGAYGAVRNWTAPAPVLPPVPKTISLTIQPIVHKSLPKLSIKTIGDKSIISRAWNYIGSFFPTRNATTTLSLIPIVNTTVSANLQIQVKGQLSIFPVVNEVITPLQIKITDVLSIFPVVNDSIIPLNIIISPPPPLVIPSLNIQPLVNQTMNVIELLVAYTIPILPIVNQNLPNIELDTIEYVERISYTSFKDEIMNSLSSKIYFFIMILFVLLAAGISWNALPRTEIATHLSIYETKNGNENFIKLLNSTPTSNQLALLLKNDNQTTVNDSLLVTFDQVKQPQFQLNFNQYFEFLRISRDFIYENIEYLANSNILQITPQQKAKTNQVLDELFPNKTYDQAVVPFGYIFDEKNPIQEQEVKSISTQFSIGQIAYRVYKILNPLTKEDQLIFQIMKFFEPYLTTSGKIEEERKEDSKVEELSSEEKKPDIIDEETAASLRFLSYQDKFQELKQEFEDKFPDIYFNPYTIDVDSLIEQLDQKRTKLMTSRPDIMKLNSPTSISDLEIEKSDISGKSLVSPAEISRVNEQLEIAYELKNLYYYLKYFNENSQEINEINRYLDEKNEEEYRENQKEKESDEFFILDEDSRSHLIMELMLLEESTDSKLSLDSNETFVELKHQIQLGKIKKKDYQINNLINFLKIGDSDLRKNYPYLLKYKTSYWGF